MKLNVYSIYDKIADEYSLPFFNVKEQLAVRDFSAVVNMDGSKIKDNPDDFELFLVGSFDTESACFDDLENSFVCNATSLLRKEE